MIDNLSDVELYPVVEIIKRLYSNIEKFPDQPKYRSAPLSAPTIKRDLAPVEEAMKFLLSSGWEIKVFKVLDVTSCSLYFRMDA